MEMRENTQTTFKVAVFDLSGNTVDKQYINVMLKALSSLLKEGEPVDTIAERIALALYDRMNQSIIGTRMTCRNFDSIIDLKQQSTYQK